MELVEDPTKLVPRGLSPHPTHFIGNASELISQMVWMKTLEVINHACRELGFEEFPTAHDALCGKHYQPSKAVFITPSKRVPLPLPVTFSGQKEIVFVTGAILLGI